MRIGYSFWGFLSAGIVDTPDGGRSHRRTLIEGLRRPPDDGDRATSDHEIVFLQANRDLDEAGVDLRGTYVWDNGLPELDALFLEWRWPIPARNTTPCGTPGHTCDLHRQLELVQHYSLGQEVPTLLWDKDLQLPAGDPLRRQPSIAVCEPALRSSPGARRLLFPIADAALDTSDASALAAAPRALPLAYVGNQYDRDEAFGRFFAPAARHLTHRVAGKWTRTGAWPHVEFTGRCSFDEVHTIYATALATVLLLPDRYARAGQMTQRLFEAVVAGCLPLTPSTIHGAATFAPAELLVDNADDVVRTVRYLSRVAGTAEHSELIADCLARLNLFRASRQVHTVVDVFHALAWNRAGDTR